MPVDVQGLLAKARWRQELNTRGYEGRLPVASERLAETLREELRSILNNDGKAFDLQVARHVYDFAIAAKDLLTVSAKSVKEAMSVIADNNGAMESLTSGDDPPPPEVASETFGARIMRELFALMPSLRQQNHEDPSLLVAAIADARSRGMPDLAAKLEQRLIGTPLEVPKKITSVEVVRDSYEHGFYDGSMQDNYDRGLVDGCSGVHPDSRSPAYREGWSAAMERRRAKESSDGRSSGISALALEFGKSLTKEQLGPFLDGLSTTQKCLFMEIMTTAQGHSEERPDPSPADDDVVPGERHRMLKSLASEMRRSGASEQTILAGLREANQERCRPPKADEELQRLAAWASQQPVALATPNGAST